MDLSDLLLVTKIQTYAAKFNRQMLSEEEAQRAMDILAATDSKIRDIKQQIIDLQATLETYQQISVDLHKAFSPLKRLSPELLSIIFLYCISSDEVEYPPRGYQMQLVLGQVCKLWREVARNDIRLWGMQRVNVRAPETLTYASHSMSPLAPLHITALLSAEDFDRFWRSTSPETFGNLRSAQLTLAPSRFTDEFDVPAFDPDPFKCARYFEQLEIDTELDDTFMQLLRPLLPWNQLTRLHIHGHIFMVSAVLPVLQKCIALADLSLKFEFYEAGSSPLDHPFQLPCISAVQLRLPSLPWWLLDWGHVWKRISSLDISTIPCRPHDQFYMLDQCTFLTNLTISGSSLDTFDVGAPVTLRRLTSLTIYNADKPWQFSFFQVHALKKLELVFMNTVDFSPFTAMLDASHVSLSTLVLRKYKKPFYEESPSLYDLLSAIPDAVHLDTGDAPIPGYILYEMGIGNLLPRLETICSSPHHNRDFLSMIKRRVERKFELRRPTLRKVVCRRPRIMELAEVLGLLSNAVELKRLATQYGFDCATEVDPDKTLAHFRQLGVGIASA